MLPLPHLRAALAARAPSLFLSLIGQELGSRFESFDALVQHGVEAVRVHVDACAAVFEQCILGSDFDLVIAGFSEKRDRGETYTITSRERASSSAWTMNHCGPEFVSPYNAELQERLNSLAKSPLHPGSDPVALGLAVMEEQRGMRGEQAAGHPPAAGVGGFCQLTTITREAIQTRILRRWNDRIGEPLGQELTPVQRFKLGLQAPPVGPHMSRQERRRAERTAGRR